VLHARQGAACSVKATRNIQSTILVLWAGCCKAFKGLHVLLYALCCCASNAQVLRNTTLAMTHVTSTCRLTSC
jgi:hypothetical protein